jgi:hypothetical protein
MTLLDGLVQYAAHILRGWGLKLELSLGLSLGRFRVPITAVNQEGLDSRTPKLNLDSRTVHSHTPARERERERERVRERE